MKISCSHYVLPMIGASVLLLGCADFEPQNSSSESRAIVCVDEGNGDDWGVNPATNEGCSISANAGGSAGETGSGATDDGVELVYCVDEGNGDDWGVNPATNEGCSISANAGYDPSGGTDSGGGNSDAGLAAPSEGVQVYYRRQRDPRPQFMVDSIAPTYDGIQYTAILGWGSVPGADSYDIYRDGSYIGTSVGNSDRGGYPITYGIAPGYGNQYYATFLFTRQNYQIVSRNSQSGAESALSEIATFIEAPNHPSLVCTDDGTNDNWGSNVVTNRACWVNGVVGAALPKPALNPSSDRATYHVLVRSFWGADRYSANFPGDAHFSLFGGMTHNDTVDIWSFGQLASPSVERMAETGEIGALLANVVRPAINQGRGLSEVSIYTATPPKERGVPGYMSFFINVDRAHPLFSLNSMLGPSPDWFVGVDSMTLLDGGVWNDHVRVDLPLYDGGTKSNRTPLMGGPDEPSPLPVGYIVYDSSTGLYERSTTTSEVVGELVIERVN